MKRRRDKRCCVKKVGAESVIVLSYARFMSGDSITSINRLMNVQLRHAFVSPRWLVNHASSFERVCADGLSMPTTSKACCTAPATVMPTIVPRVFCTSFCHTRYPSQLARAHTRDLVTQ